MPEFAAFDWSVTPLGPRESWSPALLTIYDMMMAAHVAMCATWGPEGTFLYNGAYAPFLGARHPAALGGTMQQAWPEIWDEISPLIDRAMAGERVQFANYHLTMTRNGQPEDTWWDFSYSALRDGGEVVGFLNVATEATHHVQGGQRRDAAEAISRDREQSLNALIRASSEVRYSVNADWSELLQLAGSNFIPDTLVSNRNWIDQYMPPGDRELVRAEIDRAIRTKTDYVLEHRVYRIDNSIGWAFSRAVPLLDSAGEITGWLGAATDITDRKRAQTDLNTRNSALERKTKLAEAEKQEASVDLERAWRLAQDLMVIAAPNGALEAVNERWTELLGWSEEDLIGTSFVSYTHPDDVKETLSAFEGIFKAPLVTPHVYRFLRKDGGYCWIGWTAAFESGKVYAVGRDLTQERAQAEQLIQAQKMEAVGQLTGGLAHDFNNLLAGISGSLELMQIRISQGRLKDVEKYMVAGQGAARRAAALTHRLLAFSRRQTLAPKATNVNNLVSGMLDMIQRTVGPSIQIQNVGAAGLWPALVDASQLENALLNLCINARDAMPAGGKVTIETANRWMDRTAAKQHDMSEGQYLSLCISDTGTGMPPDVIAKAFDPFFTTKPIGQGTGLGLSMIYGFAKQSGGQVRIYSEVDEGTTVCIYLPRYLGKAEADDVIPDAAITPFAEAGETVLIVDDEPTVRMLVADVLEDLGYTAIEASDGAGGLRVLQSDARIDLLVTDVGLPGGLNGRQVADAARVSRPDLKVLFITGFAENALLNSGHLEPGMSVLTKPFAVDTLAARIRELITN